MHAVANEPEHVRVPTEQRRRVLDVADELTDDLLVERARKLAPGYELRHTRIGGGANSADGGGTQAPPPSN
jgi:hypothetical protein